MNKQIEVMNQVGKIMNESKLTANKNEDTGVVRTEIPRKDRTIEEIIVRVNEDGNINIEVLKNFSIESKIEANLEDVVDVINYRYNPAA